MKSRLFSLLACTLALLSGAEAATYSAFPLPSFELGYYVEQAARNGEGAVYGVYGADERTRYVIYQESTGFIEIDPVAFGLEPYSAYLMGADDIGKTLVFNTYSGQGMQVHFWTPGYFRSFDLPGDSYLGGLSGDGSLAYGYDYTQQAVYLLDHDGQTTALENSADVSVTAISRDGSVILGNRYVDGQDAAVISTNGGAFQNITIDGSLTVAEGLSGDGQTLALRTISTFGTPTPEELFSIYLYRGGEIEQIYLPGLAQFLEVVSMSFDGQRTLLQAYGIGTFDLEQGSDYLLHFSDFSFTLDLHDLLAAEVYSQGILYIEKLELSLDGRSLVGVGTLEDYSSVAFRVDDFDTLVVPEPETYALMGLGLGMIGVFVWKRRKKAA